MRSCYTPHMNSTLRGSFVLQHFEHSNVINGIMFVFTRDCHMNILSSSNVMRDVTRLLYLLNKRSSAVQMPPDGIQLLSWSEQILLRYQASQVNSDSYLNLNRKKFWIVVTLDNPSCEIVSTEYYCPCTKETPAIKGSSLLPTLNKCH